MITPSFQLSQDDEKIVLIIRAPYVKASSVEFHLEGSEFKFYVKPYFLRLNFPSRLTENGKEKAIYDIAKGEFTVHLPKETVGEFFPDLNMISKLLAKTPKPEQQKKPTSGPLIEVLEDEDELENSDVQIEEEDDIDWEVEQHVPLNINGDNGDNQPEISVLVNKYGFNQQYTDVLQHRIDELSTVVDMDDPATLTKGQRRNLRIQFEDEAFDEDHYIADYVDDEEIQRLCKVETKWRKVLQNIYDQKKKSEKTLFSPSPPTVQTEQPSSAGETTMEGMQTTCEGTGNSHGKEGMSAEGNRTAETSNNNGNGSANDIGNNNTSSNGSSDDKKQLFHFSAGAAAGQDAPPVAYSFQFNIPTTIPITVPGGAAISLPKMPSSELLQFSRLSADYLEIKDSSKPISDTAEEPPALDPNFDLSHNLGAIQLTSEEQDVLRSISTKRYLIDSPKTIYLGLVDLLVAYCYDQRVTEEESTVESGWNICKLSATLSCFEEFNSLSETISCSVRRMLAYPLYRHWELCMKVLEDVYVILRLGRVAILKCLLYMKKMLDHDEARYLLGHIYLKDYSIWIQYASDKTIRSLATELRSLKATLDPNAVTSWDILELNEVAKIEKSTATGSMQMSS